MVWPTLGSRKAKEQNSGLATSFHHPPQTPEGRGIGAFMLAVQHQYPALEVCAVEDVMSILFG